MRWIAGLLLSLAAIGAAQAHDPAILVLGDSLSSGYGIAPGSGWVHLIDERLRDRGYHYQVVNASKPGLALAEALPRLHGALRAFRPQIVLIEIGAADGRSGIPPAQLAANLARMVRMARATGAEVALFEMMLPPPVYGREYVGAFRATYREVAAAEHVALVPFFMASIVRQPAKFQPDGKHPVAAVQAKLADAVWPTLEPLLRPRGDMAAAGGK